MAEGRVTDLDRMGEDGGVCLLGIPTVVDRFIQQAIAQILEQVWDPFFLNTATEMVEFFSAKGPKPGSCEGCEILSGNNGRLLKPGFKILRNLVFHHHDAMLCGNARKKYWHMSKIKWMAITMPEGYFIDNGLYLPGNGFLQLAELPWYVIRMPGGVGGRLSDREFYPDYLISC